MRQNIELSRKKNLKKKKKKKKSKRKNVTKKEKDPVQKMLRGGWFECNFVL